MGKKTIRVREEVYEQILAQKRSDETVPDSLERLVDRRSEFERGFGAYEDVDFEDRLSELDDRLADT